MASSPEYISSNLDDKIENSIMKTIYELTNKTLVIVAHRKSTLYNCDRILEFKNGELYKIYHPEEYSMILWYFFYKLNYAYFIFLNTKKFSLN